MRRNRWLSRGMLIFLSIIFSGSFGGLLVYSVKTTKTEQPQSLGQKVPVSSMSGSNITLPAPVGDTGLIARNLAIFDGVFAEDGTRENVFGVTALLVENTTTELIVSAEIILRRGPLELIFYAEMLPPEASVLVPEQSRQKALPADFTQCAGWARTGQELPESILVVPSALGAYRVYNNSEKTITDLAIYHKDRLPDQEMLLGGKAYRTMISHLEPGQWVEVFPAFFCWGYSDIVAIMQAEKSI